MTDYLDVKSVTVAPDTTYTENSGYKKKLIKFMSTFNPDNKVVKDYDSPIKSCRKMVYEKMKAEMAKQNEAYVSSVVGNCESSDIKSLKKEALSKIKQDYESGKITKDQYLSAKKFILKNSLLEYLPDHDVLLNPRK